MPVQIQYDDRRVQEALNRLRDRVDDLDPAMREIAGHLKDSVDEAFASQAAPDGSAWKPLEESTIADRLRNRYRAGPILERSGDLAGRIRCDEPIGSNTSDWGVWRVGRGRFKPDVRWGCAGRGGASLRHARRQDSREAVLRRLRRGPVGHHSEPAGPSRGAARWLVRRCSISRRTAGSQNRRRLAFPPVLSCPRETGAARDSSAGDGDSKRPLQVRDG